MSKSWKRTEITIETETLVVFHRGAEVIRAWCEGCEAESLMLMVTPRIIINEEEEARQVPGALPPGAVVP